MTAVASRNPFALLNEEDDFPSSASARAIVASEIKVVTPSYSRGTQSGRLGPSYRGGGYYTKGGGPHKVSQTHDIAEIDEIPPINVRKGEEVHRIRGRGKSSRGADRGGRIGRGRPFDRQSQTGKMDSDKKLRQSWGGGDGKRELDVEEAASLDVVVEVPDTNADWTLNANESGTADWGDVTLQMSADELEAKDASASGPIERSDSRKNKEGGEEDNTLTLEQYLAQKKEREFGVLPKLEGVRQANEGSDISLWDNVVQLSKGDDDAYFVGKTKSVPKQRARKDEKIYLEIDARFDRPTRSMGRSVRGGDRGVTRGSRYGRGRGGRGRGDNIIIATGVIDVAYEAAFPTLS